MPRRALVWLIVVLALVAAGCSSGGEPAATGAGGSAAGTTSTGSGDDGGADEGGSSPAEAELTVGWVFPGAADEASVDALESALDGRVASVVETDAADPEAAAQSLVSQGAEVVVSAVPGACAGVPDTPCVVAAAVGQPGANAVALDGEFAIRAYLLGRIAGLTTESDNVGLVVAGEVPQATTAVNAFALGCQSGNPNCIVRLVRVEPGGQAKAVKELVRNGADVIVTPTDDPAVCGAAGEKVLAVQPVIGPGDPCGKALAAVSLGEAAAPAVAAALDGTFAGGERIAVPLGAYGPAVPADAQAKAEERAQEIADGRDVFEGPLYDNQGEQRVAEGETVPPEDLAGGWDWVIGGVLESD